MSILCILTEQKKGKKKSGADNNEDEDDEGKKDEGEESGMKKKTRIRIKVQAGGNDEDTSTTSQTTKGKKKPGKRRKSVDTEKDGQDTEVEKLPAIPKKKKKKSEGQPKKKRSKKASDDEEEEAAAVEEEAVEATVHETEVVHESANANYLDVSFWKKEREALDDSFDAARSFLTKHGPWKLPEGVAGSKFADVAKSTITKMNKYDRYSVFAESVGDAEAPGYSDVVKKPMDFGTMMTKVDKKDYGRGDTAAAALYEDFLLVFDNCRLYNPEDSEVAEEAARILALLSESFAAACVAASKKK
jgi:hypothetical protein